MGDEQELRQFVIEPLSTKHDRAAFSCGNPELDSYLHKQAGQDLRKRAAVPFVITPDQRTVTGFYTLSQYALDLGELPQEVTRHFPKYPMVSATLIGRLAGSSEFRGQGLGRKLLMDALFRSLQSSKQVASAAVVVDAKDAEAESFYTKYGFLQIPHFARRFFLPMRTVEALFR